MPPISPIIAHLSKLVVFSALGFFETDVCKGNMEQGARRGCIDEITKAETAQECLTLFLTVQQCDTVSWWSTKVSFGSGTSFVLRRFASFLPGRLKERQI